ncbi:formylglycine-generating enzyme family protein, partial [Phaeodactylibacter xiamenensis]|uniref:formylglycine-generating enzyme family protein n=1 Tax=Phaeodactylibacter xiamenensis TaxID=1524460 RepID=UPI0024A99600
PVTQAQWQAVMGTNPSSSTKHPECPVEMVSWEDVQIFLRKINDMTGGRYRLPTEAEWTFAARGGNHSRGYKYAGSNNLEDVGWYRKNSRSKTHVVGSKQPNELGLYDMSGNVWEWCSDWYDENYFKTTVLYNPKGPDLGTRRVYRGGGWLSGPERCSVFNRDGRSPGIRRNALGFRLAAS